MTPPPLASTLAHHGQSHLLDHVDTLSPEARKAYEAELEKLDLAEVCGFYQRTTEAPKAPTDEAPLDDRMTPVPASLHGAVTRTPLPVIRGYERTGLEAVATGKVGVLLLAGGQGTRLGVGYPKGMYDIGLPSGKTLYQVQLERIRRLEELARRLTGEEGKIQMFIMTSEATKVATHQFLEKHQYFGLSKEQVTIFEQRVIPAFDNQGKFIMETKSKIARSPDGNGGLYWALKNKGVIQSMETNDVKFLHVYCVDNVLVKVADPVFMGFCISKNVESGNKVVEKGWPEEAV